MEELLRKLIEYVGDSYCPEQDSLLLTLIESAIKEATGRRYKLYTFKNLSQKKRAENEVILNYDDVILDIAEFHYDKLDIKGVVSFSENGTSVSYDGAGTPECYLARIPILAKII